MRISYLLERESFGEILERTLGHYLSERESVPYDVEWEPEQKGKQVASAELWYCNALLDAIFSAQVDGAAFEPIRRIYANTMVVWRRPLQRVYTYLATQPRLARWLSPYRIRISPPVPRRQRLLIIGGNHKLRLFDRSKNQVHVILKDGFDVIYMQREIAARAFAGKLTPSITSAAPDQSWFVEEYVHGLGLNRLEDPRLRSTAEQEVLDLMDRFVWSITEDAQVNEYVNNLLNQVTQDLAKQLLITPATREMLGKWLVSVSTLISGLSGGFSDWVLCTAHGDFQAGNVLWTHDRAYVLDWEFSQRRQRWYDLLVYGLNSRFPVNLHKRIADLLIDASAGNLPAPFKQNKAFVESVRHSDSLRLMLAIFLLEELAFRLEQNRNPLYFALSQGTNELFGELSKSLRILQ